MTLQETLLVRKTTRSYDMTPLPQEILNDILGYAGKLKPLNPAIKTRIEIIGADCVKCILPWKAPHYIAIFSEETEDSLLNVGFTYQQLDLYVQSLGLGSCWLGMGKFAPSEQDLQEMFGGTEQDEMKFVIMIAFGKPKYGSAWRRTEDFRRKELAEVMDKEDQRLKPATLAPSGTNGQPWYFIHDGKRIHVYCIIQGILKKKSHGWVNKIDIGCALAHLYLTYPQTFRFFKEDGYATKDGYYYVGSIEI